MGILNEMILYSKVSQKKNCPLYDNHDPATNYYLTQIERNHRTRWKRRRTVPWAILNVVAIWGMNLDVNLEKKRGVALKHFLDLLWNFYLYCEDKKTRDAAFFLYDDTVHYELGMRK